MSPDDAEDRSASNPQTQLKPFVYEADGKRALYFSISAIQSRLDLGQPNRLDLEYTRLMMGFLLLRPQPTHIAMIGLGGGSMARFCHHNLPGAHILVVESNPYVISLREQFQVPPDSDRFSVIETDGASLVRLPPRRFDVLLVDGYDIDGLPRSLSTQRFFDHCAHALAPGGVLVMNLHANPVRHVQVMERIRRSFGAVLPVHSSENSNCVVFACNGSGLDSMRTGPLRRPRQFDRTAWGPLQGDFSRILSAWREEFA
jgi:spermidine synthase